MFYSVKISILSQNHLEYIIKLFTAKRHLYLKLWDYVRQYLLMIINASIICFAYDKSAVPNLTYNKFLVVYVMIIDTEQIINYMIIVTTSRQVLMDSMLFIIFVRVSKLFCSFKCSLSFTYTTWAATRPNKYVHYWWFDKEWIFIFGVC